MVKITVHNLLCGNSMQIGKNDIAFRLSCAIVVGVTSNLVLYKVSRSEQRHRFAGNIFALPIHDVSHTIHLTLMFRLPTQSTCVTPCNLVLAYLYLVIILSSWLAWALTNHTIHNLICTPKIESKTIKLIVVSNYLYVDGN